MVQHGVDKHRDGPFGFTSPAIVNTIYGRWWKPEDEKPGPRPIQNSPLPWTGDFEDGLGNKITMHAYANPEDRKDELKRADGFGVAKFNKKNRTITFECWPRFAKVSDGDKAQFPGWPVTVKMAQNDGRSVRGWLPRLSFSKPNPVVQVINEKTGEVLYTVRVQGKSFQPKVYSMDPHSVRVGKDSPNKPLLANASPSKDRQAAAVIPVNPFL